MNLAYVLTFLHGQFRIQHFCGSITLINAVLTQLLVLTMAE